ncbi:MAG: glycosyltransferase, partial [Kiritimatiellae bacterium]|nr:glycosyltransferase [Kiritimatiellia bacterium]
GSEAIEIIVAGDWVSGPDTAELDRFLAHHPRIRHLRVSYDRGDSSRKKNAGWEAASSDVIAFMDDDVRVPPEWIGRIRACFTSPDVGIASGPGLVPEDLPLIPWLAGHALASPAAGYASRRYRADDAPPRPAPWSAIIGCNMAFRREVLEQIGGFSPDFWPGEEMRAAHEAVHERGWTLMFDPGAGLWHYPRPTLRGFGRQMFTYGATRIRLLRAGAAWEWTPLLPAAGLETMFWLALASLWFPIVRPIAVGLAAVYALALIVFALGKIRECGARAVELPPMMAYMHLSYALGAWSEILRPGRDFGTSRTF